MGGFSRRRSKLINSCESLETEVDPTWRSAPDELLAVLSRAVISTGGKDL